MLNAQKKVPPKKRGITIFKINKEMRHTGTQILPGITFIGWLDGSKLQRSVGCAGIVGQHVDIYTAVHEIQFCGEPQCSCKSAKGDGGGYTDTATLKFNSPDRVPFRQMRNMAFVVTDATGKSYLLGSLERPCASIEGEQMPGSPSGDAAGFAYEVRHCSYKSMVPCRFYCTV